MPCQWIPVSSVSRWFSKWTMTRWPTVRWNSGPGIEPLNAMAPVAARPSPMSVTASSSATIVVSTMFGSGLVSTTWGTEYGVSSEVADDGVEARTANVAATSSVTSTAMNRRPLGTRPSRPSGCGETAAGEVSVRRRTRNDALSGVFPRAGEASHRSDSSSNGPRPYRIVEEANEDGLTTGSPGGKVTESAPWVVASLLRPTFVPSPPCLLAIRDGREVRPAFGACQHESLVLAHRPRLAISMS